MKKLLLTIVLLSSVFAKSENDFLMDRIQLMQNLEVSMSTIQKGFLYNSDKLVQNGINKLKYNIKNIDTFAIKNDEKIDFNAKKYALAEVAAISNLANKLQEDFDKGNKEQVLDTYQKAVNRCVTCHLIFIKW